MLRNNVLIDDVTLSKLDPTVLEELVSCLWPQDCQTCGWSLGSEPCALVVDEMIFTANTALHHAKCRAPKWNDSGPYVLNGGPLLSWVAAGLIISTGGGGGPRESIPGMVLNPSLEMVSLRRASGGRWELDTLKTFRAMGFEPPRGRIQVGVPVPKSTLVMTPTSWRVHIAGGLEVYEVSPQPEMNKLAINRKGILAIITQAADPGRLEPSVMQTVMLSEQTVAGWVSLSQK
jgi:hypothetical protein